MAHEPVLWMLVGVPGSGKSTWIEETELDEGQGQDTVILSTDDYIEHIASIRGTTYNEVFHDTDQGCQSQDVSRP